MSIEPGFHVCFHLLTYWNCSNSISDIGLVLIRSFTCFFIQCYRSFLWHVITSFVDCFVSICVLTHFRPFSPNESSEFTAETLSVFKFFVFEISLDTSRTIKYRYTKEQLAIIFTFQQFVDFLKEGPGQMFPMPSSFIWPCWDSLVTFCSLIIYVNFYKVFFGGRNVCAHS